MGKIIEKGQLLISEPYIDDDYFQRKVILLCEHNDEGSIGFVLNHALKLRFDSLMEGFENYKSPIYEGGPVEKDSLHYIHKLADLPNAIEILPGVYWGGDFDMLCQRIADRKVYDSQIKFFIGYTGWYRNQLAEECATSTWIVSPTQASFVFKADVKNLWKESLLTMGEPYSSVAHLPLHPNLN